ncbi:MULTISPECIES: cell division protein ZapC [Tatumella]|mgnify:CR=1 FL=1|uniref:Cell division protein ZapC n=1 Tax=Tatumella punctata TaxID=399969 RepID=A0ABW1VSK7_9GAMM|nr:MULTISPECIES: cell division protein ZapC [unclassified Tatumella]MBS0854747.1 cell division protein ZapC [Tatumella sp. JGM16]MBS0878135.1 cell division protein ZapC [Tatumella sp. JGM82]MBS0889891.1 cell division protein ZapC [Tatumella sp. JGM94]MBS0892472.1 cell division protein ZapC [Tatumella sp. JGM130]MBS0902848.1 cell division protein ZapC [Tatumella sp. JGM100]
MTLKPDDRWQWYYDDVRDRMMLDLTEGLHFCSRFPKKMLTPDAFEPQRFCVDDAAGFFNFDEKCRAVNFSHQQRAELVLNALVASRFLKPLMPKSWHFVACHSGWQPEAGQLAEAILSDTGQPARLLVVETGSNAALCVVAQSSLELSGKRLLLGDAIKIMYDRLRPADTAGEFSLEQAG